MSRAAAFAMLAFAAAAAAEDARFIGDFEDLGEAKADLEGRFLTLEGRISLFSRGQMRFANSSLRVTLPPGQRRPVGTNAVRVRGQLRRETGGLVLRATKVEGIPDVADRLTIAQTRLDPTDASEWLELADAYRGRAAFYDDAAALGLVRTVEETGVDILIRSAGTDPEKLAEAAKAAEARGFGRRHRVILHRALRADWEPLRAKLKSDVPPAESDVAIFLDRVARDLPGSNEPAEDRRKPLEEAYARDPLGIFERADEEQQVYLGRELYAEIVSADVAKDLRPDAANADRLAARLAERLPDRPDRAAAYRAMSVDATLQNLRSLTEAEAVAFRDRLAEDGDVRAGDVVRLWLESQRADAEAAGGRALLALAKRYELLAKDAQSAEELLLAAYAADPRLVEVSDALLDRGYELVGGAWRKKAVPVPAARGDLPEEVSVGMSGADARAVLRTLPDETLRMASAGRITELWIYRTLGLVLEVHQPVGGDRSTVRKISDLK